MRFVSIFICLLAVQAALTGCQATGEDLSLQVQSAVVRFKEQDPSMQKFFNESYGYALFPRVAKGGLGIGGAHGHGEVFRQGEKVGTADLSQGSVGFQAGGQIYSEVIFFQNRPAFTDFTTGEFAFSAQASAVAAKAGAAATADYKDGVAVFTMTETGLMFEASIGGQKFDFEPVGGFDPKVE